MDVYDDYALPDGFINPQYSDGRFHIQDGNFIQQFLEKHGILTRTDPEGVLCTSRAGWPQTTKRGGGRMDQMGETAKVDYIRSDW